MSSRLWSFSLALLLSSVVSSAGCGPRQLPGLSGELDFRLRGAGNPNPFGGAVNPVTTVEVALVAEDTGETETLTLGYQRDTGRLFGVDEPQQIFAPGTTVRAVVSGLGISNQAVRALGRSLPFRMPAAGVLRVPVAVAVPDTVSVLESGPLSARSDGIALRLSPHEVLWVGGQNANAELPAVVYDHRTGGLEELAIGAEDQLALQVAFPAGCTFDDGRAVLAGGIADRQTGALSAAVFLYEAGALRRVADLPFPRGASHAGCLDGANAAVFAGGVIGAAPFVTDEIVLLDMETESVQVLGDRLSSPRAYSSGVDIAQSTGRVSLMSGGLTTFDGAFVPDAAVDFFKIVDGQVRRLGADAGLSNAALTDLGTARYGHTIVAIGSSALVYGGADLDGPLDPPQPLWFSPELSEPGAFLEVVQNNVATRLPPRVGAPGTFVSGANTVLLFGGNAEGTFLEIRTNPGLDVTALDDVPVTAVETVADRPHRFGQAFVMEDGSAIVVGGRGLNDPVFPHVGASAPDDLDILVPCSIANACRF